jgi:tetratricopeptide (TPR) repeat protein
MKYHATYIVIGLAILLLAIPAWAGDAGQESPFVIGVGARALGMGGGFVSVADDASAVFYNPAGLASLEYQEFTAMHMSLFEGTIYNFASWVYPHPVFGGFGASYMRLGTDDIIGRSGFAETGTFDYSHSQFLVSYGREVHRGWAVGVSLKAVNESLDQFSDYGVGMDMSLMGRVHEYITVGFLARDLVEAEIKLRSVAEYIPRSYVGGVALRSYPFRENIRLTSSFELEKIKDRSVKVHVGSEIIVDGAYAVRFGYDRDNASFGVGYSFSRLQLDYTYKFMDYIDDSHRVSLSVLIGSSVSERQAEERREQQRRGTVLLEDERQRQFEVYRNRARDFYDKGRLDSALTYYQQALAFDQDNEMVRDRISELQERIDVQRREELMQEEILLDTQRAAESYMAQAEAFFAKKYFLAAEDMLDLVYEIDPDNEQARELEQRIDQAVQQEIETNLRNARMAEEAGDLARAIEAYVRVLELDPDNQAVIEAKGQVSQRLDLAKQINEGIELYNRGQWREATKKFRAVLAVDSQNPVALEYLERMEPDAGQPVTLEELQADREAWQWYLQGLRHMRNQEYQQAIDVWQKVLQKYPNNPNTLENIRQARLRLELEEE